MQRFGGDWTAEKLGRIKKYLAEYTKVLKNQPFNLVYIDAFAGTGYRRIKHIDEPAELMFPDLASEETETFLAGSAQIALETSPRFSKYYFIERAANKCIELEKLKSAFPDKAPDINIIQDDANKALLDITSAWQSNTRGVLFLDPFGMNVSWTTIEAIAKTKAIDMWYLFPLGVGVNRLLTNDGNIPEKWQWKLDNIFGCSGWREQFYTTKLETGLFSDEEVTTKTGGFKIISEFAVKRLESIFPGVVKKPLPLYNSKNNPLYLLCFACGNERGAPIALRIANHILKGR